MTTLAQLHDCLLLDLDGTVFRGHEPTEGAVGALADTSSRTLFVTNNASRRAEEVAGHLRDLGFTASAEDVVTSAQSAAHLLAQQLAPKSRVLVVGTDALAEEISTVGLTPVRLFADEPVAVVQGHSVETGWPQLAEAALAIRAGALWVAANVDKTLPSERGLLPGNGSMVAALRTATDAVPQVAGKPAPALMNDALSRGTFTTPLVVGDRLDTDIAGANAAGLPSLMVLTGVNTARDAVFAVPEQRPTHLSETLTGLHAPAGDLEVAENAAWRVTVSDGVATVTSAGAAVDDLAVVRAVARAVWDAQDGQVVSVRGDDDDAAAALARWALSD
ncbi:HAD-IIA family hydrolase [Mycolicibacterium confluentis]|uniref:Phosphatase n=1 Tax=Mycolicibacterium confluentis TaxID=28047 RepID=A0A7I7XW87_9MYCO|nr:HAD-IIA family hydrolase [Mycolicibacterium confluentis]MCV7322968.1 HAD-IIA family hydrolase [Mycolicibacterium confluentis]ORV33305.1 HAD family hydrolase [Mycolicibacterium confluentis]BBZ33351.1 phosphatase [Mycolicibacterium confluentis]